MLAACAHQVPKSDATARCAPIPLKRSSVFGAQPIDTGLPLAGQWRDGFDLADMNGDGRLDLVHGGVRKGPPAPSIFLGEPEGRFRPWLTARFPRLPFDYGDIKAADFNRDGRMDLAVSVHLRGFVVLIQDQDGVFAPWGEGLGLSPPSDAPDTPRFTSREIDVADWNGDGRPDLLALNEGLNPFNSKLATSEAFAIWLNQYGYFERVDHPSAVAGYGRGLVVGDVNGDGRIDALLGTNRPGMRALLQLGVPGGFSSRPLMSLPEGHYVHAVALSPADDGRRRLMWLGMRTASEDGRSFCASLTRTQLDAGGADHSDVLWREPGEDYFSAILPVDLDHDQQLDLVVVRQGGSVQLLRATKRGFRLDLPLQPDDRMRGCRAVAAQLQPLGDHQQLIVAYAGEPEMTLEAQCQQFGGFQSWRLGAR